MENKTGRENLTDETLVKVSNEYGGTVTYKTDKVVRTFPPDSYKEVTLEELKELAIQLGHRGLFNAGYLMIKDNRVREELGLELLDKYNQDAESITAMLNKGDISEITEFLQYTSDENLEKVVRLAVDTKIKNLEVANLIHAYSGKNIIELLKEKEEEAAAKTGVRQRVDGKAPENPTEPIRGKRVPGKTN